MSNNSLPFFLPLLSGFNFSIFGGSRDHRHISLKRQQRRWLCAVALTVIRGVTLPPRRLCLETAERDGDFPTEGGDKEGYGKGSGGRTYFPAQAKDHREYRQPSGEAESLLMWCSAALEAALTKMGVIAPCIIKLTLSQQIRGEAANVTLNVDDP